MGRRSIKVVCILWLACANILLLAHTVVPHGHGLDDLCSGQCPPASISLSECGHCPGPHSSDDHAHYGSCSVDDLYSRADKYGGEYDGVNYLDVELPYILLSTQDYVPYNEHFLVREESGPDNKWPATETIINTSGLRAPPVC